jgi:hypothetical protein
MLKPSIAAIIFFALSLAAAAQIPSPEAGTSKSATSAPIEAVVIHPVFAASYACSEHWEGQLKYPGDSLGSDCMVFGGLAPDGRTGFSKAYKTDGSTNEDWYAWGEAVLAPFDSVVEKIYINPVVNKPGMLGKPPASFVIFKHSDGTRVMLAHVADVSVKEGDAVTAGKPFGKVGNNGFGRAPHIHVGAWREKTPLQIRFDLRAAGELFRKK